MNKRCGNCKHWQREGHYTWGTCWAPVPPWVDKQALRSSTIPPDDDMAEECELFIEKNNDA